MFKNYLYVSSTTRTFQLHCEELAQTSTKMVSARPRELVLDIASNDGCLLKKFQNLGMNVLGIDPAENLAAEANAAGIRTLCAYWSTNISRDIVSRFGMPKIVTATNVFAHVDDVHEFVNAVRTCLAEKGVFIIEAPYLLDFIEKNEFDTAYHEHLSYLAVHPLAMLMEAHKMQIIDVQYFADLHGGTIRMFVSRSGDYSVSENFGLFINREMKLGIKARERYDRFAQNVMKNKSTLRELIARLRSEGKSIWAYGASAKGNTLMNFFEFSHDDIPVVIDDNPKKWNYYTPGSKMRITGVNDLAAAKVDYLLLLAWNFQSEIMQRCKAVNYRGGFILPVPEPKIVS
ncbi:MAG: methyltransferase domain-containing protein [Ignavibacteriales bacterium]|nr:methyltransferase domain-containing protein [Ignavibacteriales bacterium]